MCMKCESLMTGLIVSLRQYDTVLSMMAYSCAHHKDALGMPCQPSWARASIR